MRTKNIKLESGMTLRLEMSTGAKNALAHALCKNAKDNNSYDMIYGHTSWPEQMLLKLRSIDATSLLKERMIGKKRLREIAQCLSDVGIKIKNANLVLQNSRPPTCPCCEKIVRVIIKPNRKVSVKHAE